MAKVLVAFIALFAVVVFAGAGMAQAPVTLPEKAPAPGAAPAPAQPRVVKPKTENKAAARQASIGGTVVGYEAGKMLKVKGKKEATLDITTDTKMAGEIKEGAKVNVKYKKDGDKWVATRIAVIEEKTPKSEKKGKKPMEKK